MPACLCEFLMHALLFWRAGWQMGVAGHNFSGSSLRRPPSARCCPLPAVSALHSHATAAIYRWCEAGQVFICG